MALKKREAKIDSKKIGRKKTYKKEFWIIFFIIIAVVAFIYFFNSRSVGKAVGSFTCGTTANPGLCCQGQYTTVAACASDPACYWDSSIGRCYYLSGGMVNVNVVLKFGDVKRELQLCTQRIYDYVDITGTLKINKAGIDSWTFTPQTVKHTVNINNQATYQKSVQVSIPKSWANAETYYEFHGKGSVPLSISTSEILYVDADQKMVAGNTNYAVTLNLKATGC